MRILLFLSLLLFTQSLTAENQVSIQIWHQMMYSHREVLREVVQKFETEHPEYKINLVYKETEELRSAFQAAALGGSGPDLIYGPSDQVGPFATMGIIRPLDDLFSKEDLDQFDPLSLVRFQDRLYMRGDMVGNHLALLYNKKLVSKPPATTDELISLGKKIAQEKTADGKPKVYGLAWHMMEPFFFVPWVAGFGEAFTNENAEPHLNSPSTRQAFQFMKDLKESGITPKECDYEMANALFKEGKTAMIINGDWSWGDYQKAGVDFGIARIPKVSSTGKWPAPLVATKGYSINVHVSPEKLPQVVLLLRYLMSEASQLEFTEKVSSLPSNLNARRSDLVQKNELLQASSDLMSVGQAMPVAPELRAIWDALRPQYQAVMGGTQTAEKAAELAQKNALEQIHVMNEIEKPTSQALIVKFIFGLLGLVLLVLVLRKLPLIWSELMGPYRFAYWIMLPAFLSLIAVVIYPFGYNIALSFSNLSLKTFQDWQIIGFQNYIRIATDPVFYSVLGKTILWTILNLIFHVGLGVFLGVIIDQTLPAKKWFRLLLIIPWAVPQYITALTWRGMFNQEYGAINLVIQKYLHLSPIQWLTRPLEAFGACLLTNIWLGFPFMMIVTLGGLQSIPKELYEAAEVDGATAWQKFRKITWPLLQPVLIPATTLGAIWTFNNLNVVWLVSNGGEPSDQTHILVSYVYKAAFNLYRYSQSAALSMIIFLILVVGSFLFLKKNEPSSGGQS